MVSFCDSVVYIVDNVLGDDGFVKSLVFTSSYIFRFSYSRSNGDLFTWRRLSLCISTDSLCIRWRTMFGLAVIPSVLLALGMAFSPESPRWLYQVPFSKLEHMPMFDVIVWSIMLNEAHFLFSARKDFWDRSIYQKAIWERTSRWGYERLGRISTGGFHWIGSWVVWSFQQPLPQKYTYYNKIVHLTPPRLSKYGWYLSIKFKQKILNSLNLITLRVVV